MLGLRIFQFLLGSSSAKDLFWSFISTAIRTGGGLVVLPLILVKFTPGELGLWYFFTSVGMFVLMIDVGFSVTLSRNIRYVISTSRIFKTGVSKFSDNIIEISLEEMLFVARKIYFYMSLFSVIILFLFSFYVVDLIEQNKLEFSRNFIAWLVYSVSVSLNLRYYYRGAVLNGLNKIGLSQKIDIISLIVNYSVTALFVVFNYGLISLSVGSLLGLVLRIFLYERFVTFKRVKIEDKKLSNVLLLLWPSTWRTGVSNVLGYLIKYLTTFFITIFIGLEVLGSYGITFQIITLITSVSTIWINTSYPMLSTLRIENRSKEFYQLFYSRFKKGILTFILLSLLFLGLGKLFLNLINAKTEMLSFGMSLFILIHMFIDFLTNSYGYIIMTGNKVPFIRSSVITVILIVLFNFLFNHFDLGLWGVLFASFLASIVYNYWYWIYRGYEEVRNVLNENRF
jgi:O-antigen/teichoic acid export membrane protein